MVLLKDVLYTKDHEWVKVEGENAYIGITDYAQKALGSIVYVELPEEGDEIEKGDSFGVVESVKAAADLYMPIDGEVLEVNEELCDNPALVNEDSFKNWMIFVKIANPEDIKKLLNPEDYEAMCKKED